MAKMNLLAALEAALQATKAYVDDNYYDLTEMNTLLELVIRLTPKKVIGRKSVEYDPYYNEWRTKGVKCPSCNTELFYENYCPKCGQALDWGK